MEIPKNIPARIKELNREEKKLFETYNWRADANVKIKHLIDLIKVISELQLLKKQVELSKKK